MSTTVSMTFACSVGDDVALVDGFTDVRGCSGDPVQCLVQPEGRDLVRVALVWAPAARLNRSRERLKSHPEGGPLGGCGYSEMGEPTYLAT